MKMFPGFAAGLLALSAVAWMQVDRSAQPPLASLMPAGPMIYLEAQDFRSLLSEWNGSGVKRAWLSSANYKVFANSNLLQKLNGLYEEYGRVAGFLPGLPGTLEIAGREAALGLYDLPGQQFVYITRVDESRLTKSRLWAVREKFTVRQAGGISFWFRRDDASDRTVAFAFTGGWLVLATRDDLMANTLALIAGSKAARLAEEPWFVSALTHAGAQASQPGEIRMALNMDALLADVHFRSYWIQRNVSELRPFSAALIDLRRAPGEISEDRILVRDAEQPFAPPSESSLDSAAALRALAPADAALVKAWASPPLTAVQALIEQKLLAPTAQTVNRTEFAPEAPVTEEVAGSEQDLETRIDEPALPADSEGAVHSSALRDLIARAAPDALLEVQTSAPAGRFIRTPSVIVISTAAAADSAQFAAALSSAIGTLWSTAHVGVEFRRIRLGRHEAEELNGLTPLLFSVEGRQLFLANDPALLQAALDRIGTAPLPRGPAYAAEFRPVREQADYLRIMQALDFGARPQMFLFNPQGNSTPHFFSENLNSLSSVFSFVHAVAVTRSESSAAETQRVVYR
jgi:hypothetical protein